MKTITIFIAGSTRLKKERSILKAMASDLNDELHEKKKNVTLRMRSHDNAEDSQNAYNRIISDEADIVFFIIDGKTGDKTREELNLAIESFKSKGRPDIHIFIHKSDHKTNEDAHNEGFIKGLLDASIQKYCIDYTDDDDLAFQSARRLRHYIHKSCSKTRPSGFLPWALIASVLTIIGLLAFMFFHQSQTIIIAGGGSAANYVSAKTKKINIKDYPGGFYLHLPSEAAWQLLTEEVLSNSDSRTQRYVPVCISASVATDSAFLSNIISKDKFLEKGAVISFHLGNDTLVVYAKQTDYTKKLLTNEFNSGRISIRRLAEVISLNSDSLNVLPTTSRSGTRRAYESVLPQYGTGLSDPDLFYTETSDFLTLSKKGKPFMVLGTRHYYPLVFNNADSVLRPKPMILVDSLDRPVENPIMLYCLANARDGGLEFPDVTKKLLRNLPLGSSPKIDAILNAKRFYISDGEDNVIHTLSDIYVKEN